MEQRPVRVHFLTEQEALIRSLHRLSVAAFCGKGLVAESASWDTVP